MQKSHQLEIHCESCKAPLRFSVLNAQSLKEALVCNECGKKHIFDEKLLSLLEKFEALCQQIHDSSEILGSSNVAINVGEHHVQVPFNILLTRLSSVIELCINGKKRTITFRVEPLADMASAK